MLNLFAYHLQRHWFSRILINEDVVQMIRDIKQKYMFFQDVLSKCGRAGALRVLMGFLAIFLLVSVSGATAQAVELLEKYEYNPEADEKPEIGTKIGQRIPHDLTLMDHRARERSLEDLTGDNGIVLYFVRSAVWCPYCIFQLREVARRGSIIEDTGYNVVVVSYDSVRKLSIFAKENAFPYPMLSDRGSKVIQAFGLLNEKYQPGTSYYGVPHPMIYIIGSDGFIIKKIDTSDYHNKPTVNDIREILNEIGDYEPVLQQHDVQ